MGGWHRGVECFPPAPPQRRIHLSPPGPQTVLGDRGGQWEDITRGGGGVLSLSSIPTERRIHQNLPSLGQAILGVRGTPWEGDARGYHIILPSAHSGGYTQSPRS